MIVSIQRNSNYTLELPQVPIDNNKNKFVKLAKNLGIIFDESLSWNLHINKAIVINGLIDSVID